MEIDTFLLQPLEPFRGGRSRSIDAKDFDAVTGGCDVKVPIPRASHIGWLRIQGIVPTSSNQFEPESISMSAL